jgi:hypothetical protein
VVKGEQAAQKWRYLLNFSFLQTSFNFLVEPQSLGFDL